MRRRQIYAQMSAGLRPGRSPAEPPKAPTSPVASVAAVAENLIQPRALPGEFARGQCPKCLQMIGRGVAGHRRACNGIVS